MTRTIFGVFPLLTLFSVFCTMYGKFATTTVPTGGTTGVVEATAVTNAISGTFVAPDLWYDTLEFPDMRHVGLTGAIPMASGEAPNQPAGVYTGFVNLSKGSYNISIVNDPTNCRNGSSWCGRGDLMAVTNSAGSTVMLESGYKAGGVAFDHNNQHQFYREYLRFSSNFTLPAGCLGKLMYMRGDNVPAGEGGTVIIRYNSNGRSLMAAIENTNPSANSPTSGKLPFDGKWHYVEVELDPASQHIRMWIDNPHTPVVDWNTPICGATQMPNGTKSCGTGNNVIVDDTKFGLYVNALSNGGCSGPGSESFWVDDMAQSHSRIGP